MIVHDKRYSPISVSFVFIVELTALNRNLCFGKDRLLPRLSVNFILETMLLYMPVS